MNVAMYLRKSRADENNPLETLERHKEILLSYAKDNNLTVIDIFEEVISGGMLYNRTEMLKLLDAIPSHIYDAVLCIDLDRLGRGSAADSEKIFDVLKENDVKIITLKKIYDLNNEYDEDYSEFEMFMARKELKFITRRMNRGRIKSINDGCFVSGAPFGYRNAVINKKHTLEVYEPEAKYVRMIFDNNYFNDKYQGIPIGGYNNLIKGLLEGISYELEIDFFLNRTYWENMADIIVFTGKLDEFYNYSLGMLEYRTVNFEQEIYDCPNYQGNAVINYTEHEVPYTRVIEHKHFEMFGTAVNECLKTVISKEYSVEWKPGMEPYYPVNDLYNNTLSERYRTLALHEKNVIFGGRLAEYRYYDMNVIIEKLLTKCF